MSGKPHVDTSLEYIFKIRIKRHRTAVQRRVQCYETIGSQFTILHKKKTKKITVISANVKLYSLLLAGLMFEVAGLTCEVSALRPSIT